MNRFLRQTREGQTREGEEQRATTLELFFDLVFVFAITQLLHFLAERLDAEGVLRTLSCSSSCGSSGRTPRG